MRDPEQADQDVEPENQRKDANDVASLQPGRGCYTAYLTAQGRMIADAYVYELGDLMLLSVARAVTDTVLAKFDQFIFSEDVQLGDVSDTFAQIAVIGPRAAAVLRKDELTRERLEFTLRVIWGKP